MGFLACESLFEIGETVRTARIDANPDISFDTRRKITLATCQARSKHAQSHLLMAGWLLPRSINESERLRLLR